MIDYFVHCKNLELCHGLLYSAKVLGQYVCCGLFLIQRYHFSSYHMLIDLNRTDAMLEAPF